MRTETPRPAITPRALDAIAGHLAEMEPAATDARIHAAISYPSKNSERGAYRRAAQAAHCGRRVLEILEAFGIGIEAE